jgi:hypothetical protein
MNTTFRRALVAGALSTALLGGTTSAHAEVADLGCDDDAVTAAVATATSEEQAAKQAFVTFTRSNAHQKVALLKSAELREAREAAREERKAIREAAKGRVKALQKGEFKENLGALKEARKVAREEAKEAREVARASKRELKVLVKAERKELKAAWEAAKDALEELREHAASCDEVVEAPVEDTTGDDSDTEVIPEV